MCAAHASDATSPEKATGSDAVKAALIQAAGELLGEVGPRGVSVRDIAQRAGVNHGQIHHYFGGKRGLLEAAIRHLARGHYAHSLELAGGRPIPRALSLSEDRPYFRALCQSVMDGDLELVRAVESDDELSVPRRVMRDLQGRHPQGDELEVKAHFANLAAMQLGWVAFEELLFLNAQVGPDQRESFRETVKRLMQEMIDRAP
jgi:AcrR family transcriptional regulator